MRSNIPTQASSEECAFLACLLTSNAIKTFFDPLTLRRIFCRPYEDTFLWVFSVWLCASDAHWCTRENVLTSEKNVSHNVTYELYLVCAHTIVRLFFRVHTYLRGGGLRNLRRYVWVRVCVGGCVCVEGVRVCGGGCVCVEGVRVCGGGCVCVEGVRVCVYVCVEGGACVCDEKRAK